MFRRTGPTDPANFQLLIILAQEQAWTTGFDEFVYFFLRQRTIPNCEFVDATSQRTNRMAPARRGQPVADSAYARAHRAVFKHRSFARQLAVHIAPLD